MQAQNHTLKDCSQIFQCSTGPHRGHKLWYASSMAHKDLEQAIQAISSSLKGQLKSASPHSHCMVIAFKMLCQEHKQRYIIHCNHILHNVEPSCKRAHIRANSHMVMRCRRME